VAQANAKSPGTHLEYIYTLSLVTLAFFFNFTYKELNVKNKSGIVATARDVMSIHPVEPAFDPS
jgi:hypothetical protein